MPTVEAIREAQKLTQQAILGNYPHTYPLSSYYGPVFAPLSIPNIVTAIDTIINIFTLGPSSSATITFTPASDAPKAAELLRLYTGYVQDKALEFIDQEYPYLNYSKTYCRRDVGYILSGIEVDILNGNNLQSIRSGLAYYSGTTALTSILPSDQLIPTIRTLEEIKRLASYVVTGSYSDRSDIDRTVNETATP
jgi:hypothetical protein